MYPTEQPGISYSTEIFKKLDAAIAGVDEIPLDWLNLMFDALDIRSYSVYVHDKFIADGRPWVEREKWEDFQNVHEFFLQVRSKLIRSSVVTQTEKQAKKQRERQAYNDRKKRATLPGWEKEMDEKIAEVKALNARDGKGTWHLDHIVPMKGMYQGKDTVCGLNVPWNVEPRLARENEQKGHYFKPT